MPNITDSQIEKMVSKIKKGTIVIPRKIGRERYQLAIKRVSDFLKRNRYMFSVIGNKDETHVYYELNGDH